MESKTITITLSKKEFHLILNSLSYFNHYKGKDSKYSDEEVMNFGLKLIAIFFKKD